METINLSVDDMKNRLEKPAAEEALLNSEQELKAIIYGSPIPQFIIDRNHCVVHWNKALEETTGIKASEVIGTNQHWRAFYSTERSCMADVMVDGDIERIPELYREKYSKSKLTAGGCEATDYFPTLGKDGRWLHFTALAIKNADGQVIGALETLQDITERKKAEELLRQSEERYRLITENANDTIWTIDLSGKVTYMSPSVKRLLGYTPEEAMAHGLDEVMTPASLTVAMNNTKELISQTMAGEHPKVKHLELEFIRKDGSTIWIEVASNGMFDASGRLMGIEGVTRDITDRKHAEEALKAAQEELVRKEKFSILGQLAGTVGHEIRNPLGVMSNAVYFLKTVLPDADDTVKEYLDIIKQEIGNSLRIITDLLDFARTISPHAQPVAIAVLINQGMKKCLIPENIAVAIDIQETLPQLWVDPAQLEQVFQNLITNAIQAMTEGGALNISARRAQGARRRAQGNIEEPLQSSNSNLEPDKDFIEITVSDTGGGISDENMKKLFQPLFTTKAKGIGLGLVVCKNLVEANGGKIDVKSESGKGTTFTVILPVKHVTSGEAFP